MSVLYSSDLGCFISHKLYIDKIYKDHAEFDIQMKADLFQTHSPYRKVKRLVKKGKGQPTDDATYTQFRQEVQDVKSCYEKFREELNENNCLTESKGRSLANEKALEAADVVYKLTENIPQNIMGGNIGPAFINILEGSKFLFPPNCRFLSKDILAIGDHISEKYDLILLDPPWWNKYIRRKRKAGGSSYSMMFNEDLKSLPIANVLKDDGLVVVWCTNSLQNLEALKDDIFKKWGVDFIGKWYWVKITQSGKPVCKFAEPTKKQPFEQIIFGCRKSRTLPNPPNGGLVVSVPSALHSHKPPLIEALTPYLPPDSKCLELFSRYLLPGWTSYGLEVLKFQHESLYNIKTKKEKGDKK